MKPALFLPLNYDSNFTVNNGSSQYVAKLIKIHWDKRIELLQYNIYISKKLT